jgi:2-(1,2-epoxy-1,2-dihydrophenyl)acetyl-CoA isomerase
VPERQAPRPSRAAGVTATPLLFERDGGIARLVLNRPETGNAIDVPMARGLMEAAIACDEDASIRCVVLTGAGKLFCGGGDVAGFAEAGAQLPGLLKELTAYLHMAVSRLSRMGKPLISVVNGAAAGAGLSLAILGDITIAARSARFTLAYGGLGLSPDGGATWLLPRLIGLRRAQEMMLTNRRLTADEAVAIGMITRAVEDAELAGEAAALAGQLADGPTRALGRMRTLLLGSYGNALEEQLELEARAIAAGSRDAEGREGVAAYLARRKADFRQG